MKRLALITAIAGVLTGCAANSKLEGIVRDSLAPALGLPAEEEMSLSEISVPARDTLTVHDFEGREVLIMKAVKDEDGEMVATDVLTAAMVSARFRNVAERHGKVDLRFRVTVPERMQDSRWQLRFYPDMYVAGDTVGLEPVIITGFDYRQAQLKGYQQYQKFIDKIVDNPDLMINRSQLEIFIERNLPQIFAFSTDSTEVTDDQFYSHFGVTEQDAVEHYTNRFKVWQNERRKTLAPQKYRQYVKAPIVTEGLRLDTVIRAVNGDFIYDYVQTVRTSPKLRKVDIVMDGEIYEQDRMVYAMPESSPLTFYISSISSFADESERYVTTVLERKAEANTACYIDFAAGRSDVDRSLGENSSEMMRIEDNLASLARNEEFDIDSIVVTASASPEGSFRANEMLSERRSQAVTSYFSQFLKHYRDSLRMQNMEIVLDEGWKPSEAQDIRFISRYNAENWRMLDVLVTSDDAMTDDEKADYGALASITDPDLRERSMQGRAYYKYLRQNLYPRLRTVKFDFYLHRKGMIKDTLHTTVRDSIYMEGVQAIRDRDYEKAVTILRPYHDFNAAVAFCAMDYNASAIEILESLDRTASVNYLLAILYSRKGNDTDAVQCYLHACSQDPSYVHRGNLDPEISSLINKYSLHNIDEETDYSI